MNNTGVIANIKQKKLRYFFVNSWYINIYHVYNPLLLRTEHEADNAPNFTVWPHIPAYLACSVGLYSMINDQLQNCFFFVFFRRCPETLNTAKYLNFSLRLRRSIPVLRATSPYFVSEEFFVIKHVTDQVNSWNIDGKMLIVVILCIAEKLCKRYRFAGWGYFKENLIFFV